MNAKHVPSFFLPLFLFLLFPIRRMRRAPISTNSHVFNRSAHAAWKYDACFLFISRRNPSLNRPQKLPYRAFRSMLTRSVIRSAMKRSLLPPRRSGGLCM